VGGNNGGWSIVYGLNVTRLCPFFIRLLYKTFKAPPYFWDSLFFIPHFKNLQGNFQTCSGLGLLVIRFLDTDRNNFLICICC
jgi:hypothetical protein